jgi:hypothetical protein
MNQFNSCVSCVAVLFLTTRLDFFVFYLLIKKVLYDQKHYRSRVPIYKCCRYQSRPMIIQSKSTDDSSSEEYCRIQRINHKGRKKNDQIFQKIFCRKVSVKSSKEEKKLLLILQGRMPSHNSLNPYPARSTRKDVRFDSLSPFSPIER